jgi:hypothetical protein
VLAADRLRRFFLRISLFWAAVNLLNGTAALWMLLHASVGAFLLGRSLASAVLTVAAIAWSVRVFRRSLRAEGLELRWGASAT